jgi:hypothetical protein
LDSIYDETNLKREDNLNKITRKKFSTTFAQQAAEGDEKQPQRGMFAVAELRALTTCQEHKGRGFY